MRVRRLPHRPHRLVSLLAATLVTSALPLSVARPSVADTSAPTISFRVVEPDGSLVVSPTVVVTGLGPEYSQVHVLAGGAAGQVVVPFPADDAVAAAKLAAREPVNLLIRVFDKPPGSADINAAYVTAAIGIDAFGTLRELSNVTGATFPLAAGRTDFHTVPRGFADNLPLPVGGGAPPPSDASCGYIMGGGRMCTKADYPPWTDRVLVPLADNHGAGSDMKSSITYSSTVVTTTEIALQAGRSGYFEVGGSVAYEKETTTNLYFADIGPNDNQDALLESVFERDRTWWCYNTEKDSECQSETMYRPYEAYGTTPAYRWAINDHMDTNRDCWASVSQGYEPVSKTSTTESFAFTLGPSENWAASQGFLYANTKITQQTHTGKSHIRRWDVVSRTYPYHYVYIPYGLYVLSDPAAVPMSQCIAERLGDVHTAAGSVNETALHADTVPTTETPADDEQATEKRVCGNMPDRCD